MVAANAAPTLTLNAYTSGPRSPSARFRVRQHIEPLRRSGITIIEHPARHGSSPPAGGPAHRARWLFSAAADRALAIAKAPPGDAALIQKEMIRTLYSVERLIRVPMLFDVDDAIWLEQRWGSVDRIARRSLGVICGNEHIAEHMSTIGCQVAIVPTAVDTDRYRPIPASEPDPLTIGWIGTSSGLPELAGIAGEVAAALSRHPGWSLLVVSDAPPRSLPIPADRVSFLPWSPTAELEALRRMSIGLMPLRPSDWNAGKCSYKALTYMASGVAGVISPVGMNQGLVAVGAAVAAGDQLGEWSRAIEDLMSDKEERRRIGALGRAVAESQYSVRIVTGMLEAAIRTFLA
jgi:glycosyltransferase involved in cell wall biosynthesis